MKIPPKHQHSIEAPAEPAPTPLSLDGLPPDLRLAAEGAALRAMNEGKSPVKPNKRITRK